jgi:hypothetical protein
MIKLGKACSQLMEVNNTGATKIKVAENIFYLHLLLMLKNSSNDIWTHCKL